MTKFNNTEIPRETRFVLSRDLRRLCTDRGITTSVLHRMLGPDTPYQTVASWGVNRQSRRRQRSYDPNSRWLWRILEIFPELSEGRLTWGPQLQVAQIKLLNRSLAPEVKRALKSALVEAVRGLPGDFGNGVLARSLGWRRPIEHVADVRSVVGCSTAPLANVTHFTEMLGLGVISLAADPAQPTWQTLAVVRLRDSREFYFIASGGYSPGSPEERYAVLSCLGLFLVGGSAGGNAKRAAAEDFADELLVAREHLQLWVEGAKFITDTHVELLSRAYLAPKEVVIRQCARIGLSIRPAPQNAVVIRDSFHGFRASLNIKSSLGLPENNAIGSTQ